MSNVKRRLPLYAATDKTQIEQYLKKMARKGLLIHAVGTLWEFREIEPQDLTFCVSYLPQSPAFSELSDREQLDWEEAWFEDGWKTACDADYYRIHYRKAESADGEDDAEARSGPAGLDLNAELAAMDRAFRKSSIPSAASYLLVLLMISVMVFVGLSSKPIWTLSQSLFPLQVIVGVEMLVLTILEFVPFLLWLKRAQKAVGQGELPPTPDVVGYRNLLRAAIIITTFLPILALGFLNDASVGRLLLRLVFLAVLGFVYLLVLQQLKILEVSKKLVYAVQALFAVLLVFAMSHGFLMSVLSADFRSHVDASHLPLTIADLRGKTSEKQIIDFEESESILIGLLEVSDSIIPWKDSPDAGPSSEIAYRVVTVRAGWLYGYCLDHLLKEQNVTRNRNVPADQQVVYVKGDPAPWSAQEAYQTQRKDGTGANRYLLCYPDRIVEIRLSWTPSDDEIRVVAKKLGEI